MGDFYLTYIFLDCIFKTLKALYKDNDKNQIMKQQYFRYLKFGFAMRDKITYTQGSNSYDMVKVWQVFYDSVNNAKYIEPAIELLQNIAAGEVNECGRLTIYIGSLYSLQAKHAVWPHQKLSFTKQTLSLLDKGIALSPNDIETLFIFGVTCFHLPGFFNRQYMAQHSFRKIVRLMPEQMHQYDPELLKNVIEFISLYEDLDKNDRGGSIEIKQRLIVS
jgi:hypothetical protein